jgi:hypothetical protein
MAFCQFTGSAVSKITQFGVLRRNILSVYKKIVALHTQILMVWPNGKVSGPNLCAR